MNQRTEIVIDNRTVGEIVQSQRTEAEQEGYYVPITPASLPVGVEE